ncbi:NAD(P)H-hydrate dehydratase [Marinicella rhabdoformis]|uniref:NAD(P)H-hydrate dehydratase n=1 Tax=Marinicella rhabdoformis TaxID=2580566 RepID=UPI0012AEDC9F|nr:NAD(P)H-hydrate dehydratase [Marinicella rhabdoformis]
MNSLLYNNSQAKAIDQLAADHLGTDSYELMQHAAQAIFQHVKKFNNILVIAGPGNNGGDGWVVAELARHNGQNVTLWPLKPAKELKGDASLAAEAYIGPVINSAPGDTFDCVIDAVFGSGLNQNVTGAYAAAINWMNKQSAPVFAIDIPSGLNGDTGQVMGCAVKAKTTIAILTNPPGLYTLNGKDHCGMIITERLNVDSNCYQHLPIAAHLLHESQLTQLIAQRQHNSHKGRFGHVWTAGGQAGMMGAVQLAAYAVLKSGAGAVTAVTDKQHSVTIPLQHPEIMTHAFDALRELHPELPQKPADVLAIGMGMGQSTWSKQLFNQLINMQLPKVIDADGLALLQKGQLNANDVITPHPLEAARLLHCHVQEVQANRIKAAQQLNQTYQATVILKGSGSIICSGSNTYICPYGSDALATAGSGDVLAGMVAGLIAQGHPTAQAAQLAVLWHALTGEKSRQRICFTASGILEELHLHLPA